MFVLNDSVFVSTSIRVWSKSAPSGWSVDLILPKLGFGRLVTLFGWYDLASEGRGLVNFVFQSATSGPIFLKCVDASGHMADGGTKDADFIAEQTLEVLEDSGLLGRRLSSYKVAHCYAQTPWILRWVGLSSLPPPPPPPIDLGSLSLHC